MATLQHIFPRNYLDSLSVCHVKPLNCVIVFMWSKTWPVVTFRLKNTVQYMWHLLPCDPPSNWTHSNMLNMKKMRTYSAKFCVTLMDKLQQRQRDAGGTVLMICKHFYYMFVSFNSVYVPEPWVHHQGCDFSLDSSGNPASWMLSQPLLTSLTYPFISSFLFYFLHNILALCECWIFGMSRLCGPPHWQSSCITTSSGSHITFFVSLWLLLSNLGMSMPAVSITVTLMGTYLQMLL